MPAITTIGSETAWSPDIQAFGPVEAVPEALIMRGSTVVTTELEGDAPVARVPWVSDAAAEFIAEGADIPEADPALNEVIVPTGKVSQLVRVSREQFRQTATAQLLSTSVSRAVTKRANEAFLAQSAPGGDAYTPPLGVLNTEGIVEGEDILSNLDPLADVIAAIENNGGQADLIVANPLAWGTLRKIKTGAGASTTLLGAGVEDSTKRMLGIEVVTSSAVPENELAVIDRTAIASAVGNIQVAQSEHVYFESDSIALRCTWRIGWGVQHANRLGKLAISPEWNDED